MHTTTVPEQEKPAKKCPCNGINLEKCLQPILLHILAKEPCNGYNTRKRIAAYATYGDTIPDTAATYRYLKVMTERGLLSCEDGLYRPTEEGLHCLENWKRTIRDYTQTLQLLQDQLEE